jgi:hypothetical protein
MTQGRLIGDKFWAQCRVCGVWQEVRPKSEKADLYFEYWLARFKCCAQNQEVWFTIEKVDDDIH